MPTRFRGNCRAKLKHGHYTSDLNESTWIKIKNRNYSQSEGRAEFFDRERSLYSLSMLAGIRAR
jgi:hypothetical protein